MKQYYQKATEVQKWWMQEPWKSNDNLHSNVMTGDRVWEQVYNGFRHGIITEIGECETTLHYYIGLTDEDSECSGWTHYTHDDLVTDVIEFNVLIWYPTAEMVLWIQSESLDGDEESAYSLLTKLGLWTDQNVDYLGQYFFDVDEVALAFVMATQFNKWWDGEEWETVTDLDGGIVKD